MIIEIQAKTLLSKHKTPDPLFGGLYTMNLYRGCSHGCIYCDSRSECYQIENFDDLLVKVNAIDLLRKELTPRRQKGVICSGSMSDPYVPIEARYQLTRRSLQVIAERRFALHLITKSDGVLRDVDLLRAVNREMAIVSFTLTTVDDDLAAKLEPRAPLPSARLRAMRALSEAGIHVGVTMMPLLPFLEDRPAQIDAILQAAAAAGVEYVLPAFGLTMRDRQRDYLYQQFDLLFPGLSDQYRRLFGNRYACDSPKAASLAAFTYRRMAELGLQDHVPVYHYVPEADQPSLF
ncbi:MAG: radical SAM protein [Anaerolineaceae bacterium]|nr:radical SAM protein [Anaerolineaceae bacterium]